MKILIKNANILTMDKLDYESGQIFVDNDTIIFVGKVYDGKLVPDKIIDANSNIIMPGFVNAHAHTGMSILKNDSDIKNLQDWLYDDILPMEKYLNEEIVYDATMLGIAEYVKNGITTFCDAYYYPTSAAKAVKNSGIRASICLGFHPNDVRNINDIEQEYLQNKNIDDRLSFMLYAHSIYTCDEAQISSLITLAKKHNLPLHTHMSETLQEVSDCTVKYDVTPTRLLEEYGFFDQKAMVAHAVHLDNEDIDILAKYDVSVVSNPASNLKLGSGIAPVYAMSKKGVNIALGTDGSSSNNALDMFREMYLVSTLQKALLRDASVINAKQTLLMATVNGAKALGLDYIGKIKKSYKADLIMINTAAPNLTPLNDASSAVVYSAGADNVILTMVNGKILYEQGKYYLGEDIEKILTNTKDAIKKLKG
ncbi:MAG: amidohydrolase [Clostridia bacterium]|nr:amidohydrolase [Clostridia bacterium]